MTLHDHDENKKRASATNAEGNVKRGKSGGGKGGATDSKTNGVETETNGVETKTKAPFAFETVVPPGGRIKGRLVQGAMLTDAPHSAAIAVMSPYDKRGVDEEEEAPSAAAAAAEATATTLTEAADQKIPVGPESALWKGVAKRPNAQWIKYSAAGCPVGLIARGEDGNLYHVIGGVIKKSWRKL